MKFAFNSMTRGNDASAQTGMVFGMEVVPWTENAAFLSSIDFDTDNQASRPVARALIPNSPCSGGLVQDDVGKCCNAGSDMKVYEKVDADGSVKKTNVCEPSRPYPYELMKHNMVTNAEFIAQMDSALRRKMNVASTLQTCASQLKGIPTRFDNHFLHSSDTVSDGHAELSLTVKDLRDAIDPDGEMRSVKLINWELDEFVEMFYSPCLSALHGINAAATTDSDLNMSFDFFMLEPYYNLPQCQHLSCLFDNSRWDRSSGGCKPGILNGIDQVDDIDIKTGGVHPQKFNTETHEVEPKVSGVEIWNELIYPEGEALSIGKCWGNAGFTPAALLDAYCLPRVSNKKREESEVVESICK